MQMLFFAGGILVGVYVAQTYQLPRLENIYRQVDSFLDAHRKDASEKPN